MKKGGDTIQNRHIKVQKPQDISRHSAAKIIHLLLPFIALWCKDRCLKYRFQILKQLFLPFHNEFPNFQNKINLGYPAETI